MATFHCSKDRSSSGRGLHVLDVLAKDPWMPGGDTQQGDRGTLWTPPALLPVPESVNADAHGESELLLCQSDETPQSSNVLAGLKLSRA